MKNFALTSLFLLLLFGGAQAQSESAAADRPLKIITMPKAIYPDHARPKSIQGEVVLKITLNADGTVGPIANATVKKRKTLEKYGFVESAIAAARRIRFEPKLVGGKPVTVQITRVYAFSVY